MLFQEGNGPRKSVAASRSGIGSFPSAPRDRLQRLPQASRSPFPDLGFEPQTVLCTAGKLLNFALVSAQSATGAAVDLVTSCTFRPAGDSVRGAWPGIAAQNWGSASRAMRERMGLRCAKLGRDPQFANLRHG